LVDLVQQCQAQEAANFGFCLNGSVDPQAQPARRIRYVSACDVPEAFLPFDMKIMTGGRTLTGAADVVRPDPRVVAVTLRVPGLHSARVLRDCCT
jgi:hypothetical protein